MNMTRLFSLMILIPLVGCASSDNPPTPAASAPTDLKPLTVRVMGAGDLQISGYTVTESDLPELVRQWHVVSAVVTGDVGTRFSDALHAEDALRAAGVKYVSLVKPTE
jgi:biopolymer transport protein ExbD